MPIVASDLKWYGSAVMPDDDSVLAIGGAIETKVKVEFADNNGLAQLVSSTTVDTTQQVTVSYRNIVAPTTVFTEARTLNGLTPVVYGANMERWLKAVKNAITQGDVAVESQVAVRTGTVAAAAGDTVTLDSGASAVDQFFQFMVIRITSGMGAGQIREIIAYVGSTKQATVDRPWSVAPDTSSAFRISKGMVFEKSPFEIFTVRRPFFNSAADAPGGVVRTYFDKIFARNTNLISALASCVVREQADLTGETTFGIASTTSDSGTNGAGNNRQITPAAITFDTADKNVPGGSLHQMILPGAGTASSIGVWLKLTRQPGDAALNQPVTMRLQGVTS